MQSDIMKPWHVCLQREKELFKPSLLFTGWLLSQRVCGADKRQGPAVCHQLGAKTRYHKAHTHIHTPQILLGQLISSSAHVCINYPKTAYFHCWAL